MSTIGNLDAYYCTGDLFTGTESPPMEIKVCIAALVLKYFSGEVIAGIGSSIILQLAARIANTHQDCVEIHHNGCMVKRSFVMAAGDGLF